MHKTFNVVLVVVGILFIGLAVFYWMTPANMLPSYLPGYDTTITRVHFKHGLGALIVGIAILVWVWFRTGKKRAGPKSTPGAPTNTPSQLTDKQ
jgi:hypothetical protein